MKKLIAVIVLMVCTLTVASQNVSVKGKTINAKGKTIEIYKEADKFSKQEQLLDSYTIDDNQIFEFAFTVKYPTLVFIQIENYSQSFFVEPGKDYELVIHEFRWNIDEEMNVYQNPVALPVEFVGLNSDEDEPEEDALENMDDKASGILPIASFASLTASPKSITPLSNFLITVPSSFCCLVRLLIDSCCVSPASSTCFAYSASANSALAFITSSVFATHCQLPLINILTLRSLRTLFSLAFFFATSKSALAIS